MAHNGIDLTTVRNWLLTGGRIRTLKPIFRNGRIHLEAGEILRFRKLIPVDRVPGFFRTEFVSESDECKVIDLAYGPTADEFEVLNSFHTKGAEPTHADNRTPIDDTDRIKRNVEIARTVLSGGSRKEAGAKHGISVKRVADITIKYCSCFIPDAPHVVLNKTREGRGLRGYIAAADYFLPKITLEAMLQRHAAKEAVEKDRVPKHSPFRKPSTTHWNEVAKVGYPPAWLLESKTNTPPIKFLVRSIDDVECACALNSGGFATSAGFRGEVVAWAIIEWL